ncbi:tetratricopeptide repeat protein [Corallococcus sp. CA054B]|uniref:tetratricopeptide repeat protein n=1 Tax=Corallococcus sp. CA054B TaxID=2316734 RepID=UPI000EA1CD3E|nr:tetratricopeptide repeat protein [Corallococcus sp. CA054B]RKG67501.1 tetratricopeptide repeat protein [Corallococcus sp. CA054B]
MERNGRQAWPPELSEPLREVDRLRRGGRYTSALALARTLAEAHPTQVRVLVEVGLTLGVWGGQPAEALPWYDRVLELAPGHVATRYHRALTLARLGRHAEAVEEFAQVEAAGFRKALVLHMKRAESLEALGRLAEAEKDWTAALAEDRGNPWLLQQRARCRALAGRPDAAEQDLTDALASQQGDAVDPELLHERGVLRLQRGEVAGARADFDAGLLAFRVGDPPSLLDALRKGLQDAAAREGGAR